MVDAIWEQGDLAGRRVLDVGCGTGRLAEAFVERGAQVWGVDPSPEMLAQARARLGRRAGLELGRAEALPYRDGRFERAVLSLVVQHVERERALPELARVLVPDGRVVIATFAPEHFDAIWLARFFPSLAALDRARFPDPGHLASELTGSGFARARLRELALTSSVSREEALEKLRRRYISTLWLLDEDEYRAGLARAERELAADTRYPVEWRLVVADRA